MILIHTSVQRGETGWVEWAPPHDLTLSQLENSKQYDNKIWHKDMLLLKDLVPLNVDNAFQVFP